MLALLVVGSTVNFLLFGAEATTTNFSEVMAALSTLSGSIIGFYSAVARRQRRGGTRIPPPERGTSNLPRNNRHCAASTKVCDGTSVESTAGSRSAKMSIGSLTFLAFG